MQKPAKRVLAIFESPTVFILECTTPEVVSALGINPELELTILLRKNGVIYTDRAKKVQSSTGKITAGEAWGSLSPLFKGNIFAVQEDVIARRISDDDVAPQITLIPRKKVASLIDKSDTVMVY